MFNKNKKIKYKLKKYINQSRFIESEFDEINLLLEEYLEKFNEDFKYELSLFRSKELDRIKKEKEGRITWEPITTKIVGLEKGGNKIKELTPGGSSGILTKLDPSIVKSDSLVGNVAGLSGQMPEVLNEIELKPQLLERVVGSKTDLKTEEIKINENLMLNMNATVTLGTVTKTDKKSIKTKLKVPICANKGDRVTISRMLGSRWRLIGYSEIV